VGYRRWSHTYAEEDNELQRLESELRRELMPPLAGQCTLEVGAGTGRVTQDLREAGADVIVVDLVVEMLLRAPDRAAMVGRACVARAEALPFAAGSFDRVVCALTLGHVADLAAALRAMVEVLRPGGELMITDFHPDATLRGWQRSFTCEGRTCVVQQHAHSLVTYTGTLDELGCGISATGKRRWQGQKVLFGLRASKSTAEGQPAASPHAIRRTPNTGG
jgi:malonyl-CoA O-methyltransferase